MGSIGPNPAGRFWRSAARWAVSNSLWQWLSPSGIKVFRVIAGAVVGVGTFLWSLASHIKGPVALVIALAVATLTVWLLNGLQFKRIMAQFDRNTPATGAARPIKVRALASPEELQQSVIRARAVRLTDLLSPYPDQPPILRGRTLEDCVIVGPSIVVLISKVNWTGNHFRAQGPDGLLYPIEEGKPFYGVIGLVDCTFDDCDFWQIGIAATPHDLPLIRQALTSGGEWSS